MAKLTVKITNTGEEFEIFDVDLNQLTPRQLFAEMVRQGLLPAGPIAGHYTVLSKNEKIVDDGDLDIVFARLSFVDGDSIKIIIKASGASLDTTRGVSAMAGTTASRSLSVTGTATFSVPSSSTRPPYTYESMPFGFSTEEKIKRIVDERISILQLDQLWEEEQRIKSQIDRIRYELDKQKHLNTYCVKQEKHAFDELLFFIEQQTGTIGEKSRQKMHELLCNRLTMIRQSSSFLAGFYKTDEIKMIIELLGLLDSFAKEREEMLSNVQVLLQKEINVTEHKFAFKEDEANRGSERFLNNFLLDSEKKLEELISKKLRVEHELEKIKEVSRFDRVYSSVFAPAEMKRNSHMLVQVYLHLLEETEIVKELGREAQNNAERRGYIPLQCKLKEGDRVDILLNIYGETLLQSETKSIVWQGSFNKCSFDFFVSKDIVVGELSVVALLTVNGVPVGEMQFVTEIVDIARQLNTEIIAHKYSKGFISYSHQDEAKVKFLHEGLELGSVPHFFDRNYLKTGDVFPQVIKDYIDSADLFVLCWSENASKSEYVQKERLQAMGRAFPQIKPEKAAKLRIYPMSIEPHAELPSDMKEYYHFGVI